MITDSLSYSLKREGFEVSVAANGREALAHAQSDQPDLIVLDLKLPEIDGMEVCRRLRMTSAVPIIMLTARGEESDRIAGLEVGADDYLPKPFNPRELVARVKAILRRSERTAKAAGTRGPIHLGSFTIDEARHEVTANGRPLNLRAKEFDLLLTLVEHRGIVLSREQLLSLVWGFDFYGQTRTVDVHVAHLRKRLVGSSISIETVTGVGYKLVG